MAFLISDIQFIPKESFSQNVLKLPTRQAKLGARYFLVH